VSIVVAISVVIDAHDKEHERGIEQKVEGGVVETQEEGGRNQVEQPETQIGNTKRP
jgi:hypothetical protein